MTKQIRKIKIKYRKVHSRKEQKQMKKLEEILRDKPIKNKLSFAFRIMDILYVVLALVAVVELIRSKGYIGSIVVVVLLVLAIIFNASMSKMLAKMLIDPITNLVTASEKIASGDFEIGVPYESEDELGRLSDSFETAAAILKKVVSDLQTIVEQFSDGNFDVHSSCPEAYVGQLRDVLDELDEMVNKVSETMHGIQDSSEQVSAGSNQLAVSAQDIAEGATHQAASVEELVATVDEVTSQVLENTKSTDIVHDKAKKVGIEAANSQKKMDELVEAMKKINATTQNVEKKLYAVQFHPEVLHTKNGTQMIYNFVRGVCGCAGTWKMDSFVKNTIDEIREQVGDGKVLLALSGGVDSSVLAALLAKAIGKQLTCVFVDHGLLRKNEGDEVEGVFGKGGSFDINFVRVNAQERYYSKLAGVTEPERKRKIIGEEFIRVFEEEAKKIGKVDFLAQGTIYPDVVESGLGGESAVIKSHHNVGGLPEHVDFKDIVEPLRNLFKDEVRKVGLELGLPDYLVFRQPFPGPGLGIRIIGEVTAEKVRIVQDADWIYRSEVEKAAKEYKEAHGEEPSWMPNQYFAALTNMRSVGVMGDERTYDYAVAVRAVRTVDFMTAEAAEIPFEVLQTVMSRIINEVKGVNRVFYDLTSKPPGTIEFE